MDIVILKKIIEIFQFIDEKNYDEAIKALNRIRDTLGNQYQ
jgi:hypothetical protein